MKNLKKKVALLLALVMMLSLVPVTVFGSDPIGELLTEPARVGYLGNYDTVTTANRTVQFRIPAQYLSTTSWGALSLRATLNDDRGTAVIGALSVIGGSTDIAPNSTARPGVGASTQAAGTHDLIFPLTQGTALTTDSPLFGGYVDFQLVVQNVNDRRVRLTVDLINPIINQGMPQRVLTNAQLVIRQQIDGLNENNFTVASTGTVPQLPNLTTAQGVSNIRISEYGRLPLTATRTFEVVLTAPSGYLWPDNNTHGSLAVPPNNGFAQLGAAITGAVNEARTTVTFTDIALTGRHANATLAAQRGFFDISGLQLRPVAGRTVRNEDLNVSVAVTEGGAGRVQGSNSVRVATQTVRGINITAATAPTIRSGITPGSGWNSAVITVEERGAGSFLQAPIMVTIDTPGVEIAAIRSRNTHGSDNAWRDWNHAETSRTFVSNTQQMVTPLFIPAGPPAGTIIPRRVEIELRLRVAPGLGDTDVRATVTAVGLPATVSQTLTIAEIEDPITITAGAPVVLPFSHVMQDFDFFLGRSLTPVTVDAVDENVFEVDNEFRIFLRAIDANGNPFAMPTLGLGGHSFNVTAAVDGQDFELSSGSQITGNALNVSANGGVLHAFAGVLFTVNRASNEPASVTFSSSITGLIPAVPGIQLEMVIKGSAVQSQEQQGFANSAYRQVIAIFGADVDLEPDDVPPGQAPGQIVVPRPDNYVGTISQFAQLDGQPAVIGNALSLRFFANVIPGSTLDFENGYAIINAMGADGNNRTVVMAAAAGTNSATVAVAGGEPRTVIVGAAFNQDGRIFVPISAIPSLFGFSLFPDNGQWLIVPAA
ncbi:MAG: hypothetical protein FWC16_13125 [Defluviitaleaceae bacterium]|nr:hypothetical protein [Defluviitaleaceae bacterium]MCL2275862.1 hypothetical protein [Defluviitaleaceae bacterium]